MKSILLACVKAGTGWVSQLAKVVQQYKIAVNIDGESAVSMPDVAVSMRKYWWAWLRKYISTRPQLSHLLPSLPVPTHKLPWEERTTHPPHYLHHSIYLRCPDGVRACISVRSGFVLVKCKCGTAKPSLLHLLWSCPTLHDLKLPLIASHAPLVLSEMNVVSSIMDTLCSGGPLFLCTFHFVYKAYFHQADV